jgi:hypothetical protein
VKIRIPVMIQDPAAVRYKELPYWENVVIDSEAFCLDGPVSRKVALLDFDPDLGVVAPDVPYVRPSPGRVVGRFKVTEPTDDPASITPEFMRVSAFGTVLATIGEFEEDDTLGRPVEWAFDGPQLLVVPRAGRWENAFYDRDSHSLQFFFFADPRSPMGDATIYTALSRDVVAHETGHAILDGIARDLYNALSPESLALHEAVADLTAFFLAVRSEQLRTAVLRHCAGSIASSNAFSAVAEEFGGALGRSQGSLRDLSTFRTLDPDDAEHRVASIEPHDLSEVLGNALYAVLVRMYADHRERFQSAEAALAVATKRFKRLLVRGLDYLPPGEITFADLGRAMIAADRADYPDPEDGRERGWLAEEFARRHMAPSRDALETEEDFDRDALRGIDLQTLVDSDWAAYQLAGERRDLFGAPDGVNLWARPRRELRKKIYRRGRRTEENHECLFKVSWDVIEENALGRRFPRERQITVGTTLAIDWETGRIRARLISDSARQAARSDGGLPAGVAPQRAQRDQMLSHLYESGRMRIGEDARGPDGKWLRSVVRAESLDGLMRVRATARMLHMVEAEE